jgi:hypothetical protein
MTIFLQYHVFCLQNPILSRASSTELLPEKCIVKWVGRQSFDIVMLLCMTSWGSEDEAMTWREYVRQKSVEINLSHPSFADDGLQGRWMSTTRWWRDCQVFDHLETG